MLDQIGFGDDGTGSHDDRRGHGFAPPRVGHTEHRALEHCGMTMQRCFDLGRIHVEPTADDHVALTVHDGEEAVAVLRRNVAGAVPAVDHHGGGRFGVVPIPPHDVVALDPHLALVARRNRTAVLVRDGHLAGSDLAADGSETRVVGVDVIGAAEHQNGMRRLTRSVDLHEDVAEFVESIA